MSDLRHLPLALPALTELRLYRVPGNGTAVDLRVLEHMTQLRIHLHGFARGDGRIRGAHAFEEERLEWH